MITVPPEPGTTGIVQGGAAHWLLIISQSVTLPAAPPSLPQPASAPPQLPLTISIRKTFPGFELKKMCGCPDELMVNVTRYQSSCPCGGRVPLTLVDAPTPMVPIAVAEPQELPAP